MNAGDGPSRREILAGASGIGVFGAVGGAGTYAMLNDSERFPGSTVTAGELDLDIDCADGGCETSGNAVSVGFEGIEPGDTDARTIEVTAEGNPARLWFRTACPPASDPLGDALAVTLTDDEDCGGSGTLFSGSLTDLRREFTDGVALAEDCLDPGDTRCLSLEWSFPEDGVEGLVGVSTDLDVEFVAEQCRHSEETGNPFGGSEDCPDLSCPDCVELGKADVDPDSVEPGESFPIEGGDGYEIEFLSVTNKEDGGTVCGAIRLLQKGSEEAAPAMCKVIVGGGGPPPGVNPPGNSPGEPVEFEIDPPATRTPHEVCAGEAGASGNQAAISNITVYTCPEGGQ